MGNENVMPPVVLSHLCTCSQSSQSIHALSMVAENIHAELENIVEKCFRALNFRGWFDP